MNILLVDDDEDEFILLKEILSFPRVSGSPPVADLTWVGNYEDAAAALSDPSYDVFLVDYHLGEKSGLDLLRRAAEVGCRAPIIILTGQGDYDVDLAAMQLGADDYVVKNQINLPLLERAIRYSIEKKRARNELEQRAAELDRLQTATTTLLKTLDLEALLTQILAAAQAVIPAAEKSWLYLANSLPPATGELRDPDFKETRIRPLNLDHRVYAPVEDFSAGNCVLIGDTQGGSLFQPFGYEVAAPGGVRSALVVPLALEGEKPGALVLSASRPFAFSDGDRRLLATFAATAALALKNALLHRLEHTYAITDPLTGQLNRREFFELGQREMERYHRYGRKLSLILFDIDRLKNINDTFGHAAGDQVIRAAADRCHAVLRQVDILGRLGGDEFAVIVPEVESATEKSIAERIRHIISGEPVTTDAGPVSVTVSVGVSRASQSVGDLNTLLGLADKALYRAKNAGRNCIEVDGESQ